MPTCTFAFRPRVLLARLLLALVPALCLWVAGLLPALAAPDEVAFPAAAGIRLTPPRTGPVPNATGISLVPNDVVALDTGYTGGTSVSNTGGAILNFSVHDGGNGAETVLASSSISSTVPYGESLAGLYLAVSPAGMIYYCDNGKDTVALDPTTLTRTVASSGSDATLGPTPHNILCLTWDFATGTILYFDNGITGSTRPYALSGFYRVDPATGVRTVVSLNGNNPGSGVTMIEPIFMVTDPFGNLFYLDDAAVNSKPLVVLELPVTTAGGTAYGARRVVSSNSVGTQTDGTFLALQGLWLDNSQPETISGGLPAAESLIVTDEGTAQTNSAIYRIPTDTGNHSRLITYNSTNANTGSATFDLPVGAVADTTGRIYYDEMHNGTNGILTAIPAGTHAAASLTGAENLSINSLDFVPVPPPQPTLAAGTASSVLGTTATLNSAVTADGGVANAGVIAYGFVYAPTATNAAPRIGGAGVTQVSNFVAATLPVAQNGNLGSFNSNPTGLTAGTSYTFSAYAQNVSGFAYSAPVAFTTPTPPSVTTSAASGIMGTSATLNGNVTSNGGATLSARGFVYSSTYTMPTLGQGTTLTDGGTATGTYADTASSLANSTTYYFRAYATNAGGTAYGSVLTFQPVAPPTADNQSENIGFNTASFVTLTGSDPNTPAQSLTYTVTTGPTHGTLSGTAPNLIYTPAAGYHGTDTLQFTTTNTSGLTSNTATVTLTVATGSPMANSQSVNVAFNTATAVTLTATDPNAPPLPLTYTVIAAPAYGTLSGTAPNLTYTPTVGYHGSDSFTFRASNGTATSNTGTVSITVIGQPTISSFTPASGPVGTTVTITGTNLQNATGVNFFRNLAGTGFTVVSSTRVTVKVPTGAGTGTLTVLSSSGSNSSSTKFVVTQ